MTEVSAIPSRLPVLPLPYPLVLHPSLLLSCPLSYAHSLSLLKAALQATGSFQEDGSGTEGAPQPIDASKPILVACIPARKASHAVQPSQTDNRSLSQQLDAAQRSVRVNDLHEWGVVARLVRLVRQPATETCVLTVTGVVRVRIDRWLSMRAPLTSSTLDIGRTITVPDIAVPLASVTTYSDELPWPASQPPSQGDRDSIQALRVNALELLDAITSLNPMSGSQQAHLPLMPVTLIRKIRSFVREARDTQAAQLADVLVGSLGGACEWSDRLALLADIDQGARVQHAAKILSTGAGRVRLARELLMSLTAPLNDGAKEALVRSQLETLLTQLAALNPNVSAKISTPSGSFSITSGESKGGQNGANGIVRIRSPNTSNSADSGPKPLAKSGGNPFRGPPGGSGGNPFGGRPGGNGGGDGDGSEEEDEVAELSRRLDAAQLSPEARKVCDRELKRLGRIPPQSVERGVVISYLEVMAELPWDKVSADLEQEKKVQKSQASSNAADGGAVAGQDTIAESDDRSRESGKSSESIVGRARRILDEDHYGMEKVKKRLVEYLAVLELKESQARESVESEETQQTTSEFTPQTPLDVAKLSDSTEEDSSHNVGRENVGAGSSTNEKERKIRKACASDKGPILLLVGPPGTGKTSIARSLATALRRPFTRLSLGGVRDEASLRGHRRTYVGALPGEIVSSLRKVGVSDPVLLLDEVDKLGSGNGLHGDPSAAMLEVLDPEQNHTFTDHYIGCPVDLSRVLFIATANTLDTISPPLLDRTEVIHISGYTHDEKVHIARSYLVPKSIKAVALTSGDVQLSDDVLLKIAMSYTREAGVRQLERNIATVVRGKAVEYAEKRKGERDDFDPVVKVDDVRKYLGIETFEPEVAQREARPGNATGLAYQGSGSGGILFIETLLLPPGNTALKLTGSLGDVIRESATLAFSWIQAHAFQLGITSSREAAFPNNDVHLHFPAGAIPKDGPSAGVAILCALASLFTRTTIDPAVAMTGEISLRGLVMPVGGIREKVIGAHRAGIKKVLLPERNRADVEQDVPDNVKNDLRIIFVRNVWAALDQALGDGIFSHVSGHHEGVQEGRRRLEESGEGARL